MAKVVRMNCFALVALALGIVLAGCLPEGCFGRLAELKDSTIKTEKISMSTSAPDGGERKPSRHGSSSTPPPGPGFVPACQEFASMRLDPQQLLIFVDKNASQPNGAGQSWDTALKSVGQAVQKAINEQANSIGQGHAVKNISIIVAGGDYTMTHERSVRGALMGNQDSIISLVEGDPKLHKNIAIFGGFRSGDACFEAARNRKADDPADEAARITTLDGEGQSNNVVEIYNGKTIKIQDFTITHGHARDMASQERQMGGGLLVRGDVNGLELRDITIKASRADDKGGCIAIIGNAQNVQATNITVGADGADSACKANNGGGGVFIGGNTGTAAGLPHDSIKFVNARIQYGIASQGGGVFITDQAKNIKFENTIIANNKAENAASTGKGAGVYITGNNVGPLEFYGGSIDNNRAQESGGGVLIENTALQALVPYPNNLPSPRFLFSNLLIHHNSIQGNNPSGGAGVGIRGPAGDIKIFAGGIYQNHGNAQGVGIYIEGRVRHVVVEGVTIDSNHVEDDNLRNGMGASIIGMGINRPERIEFKGGVISKHTGDNGAGIWAQNAVGLVLDGAGFRENKANNEGGGGLIENTTLYAHMNVQYIKNAAGLVMGGGVGGGMKFSQVTFENIIPVPDRAFKHTACKENWAAVSGGCLAFDGVENVKIVGGKFEKNGLPLPGLPNLATTRGGAVYYNGTNVANRLERNFTINNAGGTDATKPRFDKNKASQYGGAVYADNVYDLEIRDAILFQNEVLDVGGNLYVDNLIKTLTLRDSQLLNGKAQNNAGCVYVRGSNVANAARELSLRNVELRGCIVENGGPANGAAGIYMTRMNVLEMRPVQFLNNHVLNAQNGSNWAAALKFNDRADAVPFINPLFNPNQPTTVNAVGGAVNPPLLAGRVPIEITGPVNFNGNVVEPAPGAVLGPQSIGTMSIPSALHPSTPPGVPNFFIYKSVSVAGIVNQAQATQQQNSPPPASNSWLDIVISH